MYFNMANLAKICAAAYVAVVLVAPGVDAQGCTQCVTGFTNEVPPAIWAGSNCNKYDPEKVDWDALRDDIVEFLGQSGAFGPDRIPASRFAPFFIRGAFHDAGARLGGVGGADGSMCLAPNEQNWIANSIPFKFVPYVKAALWQFVDKYGVSWADIIAVSGAAAAQFLGAKTKFPLVVGRCDANFENPEKALPFPNTQCNNFEAYWKSVGLDLEEGIALLGSHCVADATNKFASHKWDNSLFRDSLTGTIRLFATGNPIAPEGVQWSQGPWRYTVNDAMDAPQNANQNCPFQSGFANSYNKFAFNSKRWDDAYMKAYAKMTLIGATLSPKSTVVKI